MQIQNNRDWSMAALASAVLFAAALLASAPVQANLISFTTQFGDDGSGSFVYDDDNGGTNRGFTSFVLNFSPALGTSFASIEFTGGVESSAVGPGGSLAQDAYDALSGAPVSSGSAFWGFFSEAVNVPMNFIVGQVDSAGTGSVGGSTVNCDTPAAGGGEYAFCADVAGQVVTGEGNFSVVPEPASLALIGLGLAGLAVARRRKR